MSQKTIFLTSYLVDELAYKLDNLRDWEEEDLEDGVFLADIENLYQSLRQSLPKKDGKLRWSFEEKFLKLLEDEMIDYPSFLRLLEEPKKKKNIIKNINLEIQDLGHILFQYDDGGRSLAGYKGDTGDCVTRAISIASRTEYKTIYDLINKTSKESRGKSKKSNSRKGVHRKIYEKILLDMGWEFVPMMGIGTGCKVHLNSSELPKDKTIIIRVSRHLVCYDNGVLKDIYDCSRDGKRCVYGYYQLCQK